MRTILHAIAIFLLTLFFGILAIAGCLLIPNGNPLVWMARPWARGILAACGTKVRVIGRERLPAGRPVLYITNHQSLFDVLALVHALPGQYRVVAKKELFRIPVFGWALWLAGFISIDRSDREKAFRSLDRAAEKIRSGKSVVVFAEGTRSDDGALLPFKKGGFVMAIRSGCPIVPISLSGSRYILPRGSLRVRPGAIDVVIGEPIETDRYVLDTKEELMARVRAAIQAGFTDLRRLDAPTDRDGSPRPATGV